MLEIFALIAVAKKIRKIVEEKGLKATKYIIFLILLWIVFEFIGAIIGILIFGEESLINYLCALIGAAVGAYIAYFIAEKAQGQEFDKKVDSFGVK